MTRATPGRAFAAAVAEMGAAAVRPARKDEPGRGPHMAPVRQRIASIFWICKDLITLERHGGRTIAGLHERILARFLCLANPPAGTSEPCSRRILRVRLWAWNQSSVAFICWRLQPPRRVGPPREGAEATRQPAGSRAGSPANPRRDAAPVVESDTEKRNGQAIRASAQGHMSLVHGCELSFPVTGPRSITD